MNEIDEFPSASEIEITNIGRHFWKYPFVSPQTSFFLLSFSTHTHKHAHVLSLSPSYMNYLDQYEDFLLKNASQITGIEASLRSLTYILPGNHPITYPPPCSQTV